MDIKKKIKLKQFKLDHVSTLDVNHRWWRKPYDGAFPQWILDGCKVNQVFVDGDEDTKDAEWVVSKRNKDSKAITEKQAETWLESALGEHEVFGKGYGWTAAEAIQSIANGTLTVDDLRNEIMCLDEDGQCK